MKKEVLVWLLNRSRSFTLPGIYLEKAEQAIKEGNPTRAKLALERTLEIDPQNHRAQELLRTISP